MKIVNRIEFLKLPSGTLFYQGEQPWTFDDLHVKFESLIHGSDGDGDFVSMPFTSIGADSSGQWSDRLDEMAEHGVSYPLDLDNAGRDGRFQRQALFLVFEQDDVLRLRDFLNTLLASCPPRSEGTP